MAIYVNSGIGAQLMAVPETTYGVVPTGLAGGSAQPYEFDSETLELKKNTAQGQGLHAGGVFNRAARRKLTYFTAGGSVTMDMPTRHLNILLQQMMGSKATGTLAEIGTSGVYKAVHAPGSLQGTSLCIQKGVPSVDGSAPSPFTYTGQKVTEWEISVATGAIAKLNLTFNGRNELGGAGNSDPLNASVPALATYPAEDATNDIFYFREASLLTGGTVSTTSGVSSVTGGTAAGNVRSVSVKQAMSFDMERLFLGSAGFIAEPIENNWRQITGSFVVEWLNSEAMYAAFAADTPTSLQLTFTGSTIGTSGTNTQLLQILIPEIFLDGESPKVGGPAVVTQNVTFTGLDDSVNNPIQITYQTLDTV